MSNVDDLLNIILNKSKKVSDTTDLINALHKKHRNFVRTHQHHIYKYDCTCLIVSSDKIKGEFSYHSYDNAIYIREDLYKKASELIEFKAYTAFKKHCELVSEAREKGLEYSKLNARFKKESLIYAKEQTITKFGEEAYYELFEDERKEKAKSEKQELKRTIKSNKEVLMSNTIPECINVSIDDIIVKQVEEALKINNVFQTKKALLDDFDNETTLIEDIVEEIQEVKEAIIEDDAVDLGLTDTERHELVEDIFTDTFTLDDFLDGDLF